MFVVLEHRCREGTHWDFMLAFPGRERLATWRLEQDPTVAPGPIRGEPIGDHRRDYLDYEGPLSGDRGFVTRRDRGEAVVLSHNAARLRARLEGVLLRGEIEIRHEPAGPAYFLHVSGAAGAASEPKPRQS